MAGCTWARTADHRPGREHREVVWDKQFVDSAKESAGFSGAGTFVNSDLLVIGQNGGEYPVEGKIFGIDPKNGNLEVDLLHHGPR